MSRVITYRIAEVSFMILTVYGTIAWTFYYLTDVTRSWLKSIGNANSLYSHNHITELGFSPVPDDPGFMNGLLVFLLTSSWAYTIFRLSFAEYLYPVRDALTLLMNYLSRKHEERQATIIFEEKRGSSDSDVLMIMIILFIISIASGPSANILVPLQ